MYYFSGNLYTWIENETLMKHHNTWITTPILDAIFSVSLIWNVLVLSISVCVWIGSASPSSSTHTPLCQPGSISDMCPSRDIRPNDTGNFGFKIPSLLRQSLSKSGSKPHACNIDMNSCAISMVRLWVWICNGSGLLRLEVVVGELLGELGAVGLRELGWLPGGWLMGVKPWASTLAWIFWPTVSAVSFTLAKIPEYIKTKHLVLHYQTSKGQL